MDIPSTDVTLIDKSDARSFHIADGILINGEEVLVEEDSVHISFGQGEVTKVTLTIIPTTITFK